MQFKDILLNLAPEQNAIDLVADYLGYDVGENPINPKSDWKILLTHKEVEQNAVIALKIQSDLDNTTDTRGIRSLYKQVVELDEEFENDYSVQVAGFVGNQRIVFFKFINGNRDIRLDLNQSTVGKELYLNNLHYLKESSLEVEEDDFGFGTQVKINDDAFKKELTTHFLSMIAFYRKKLSELIVGSSLKKELEPVLSEDAKLLLKNDDLALLVQNDTFTSGLSTVVDTIILRQLMRRFLEAYYGAESFNVDDIALGVGSGTFDDAIKSVAEVAKRVATEKDINKFNKQVSSIQEISLFDDLFTEEELSKTSQLKMNDEEKVGELVEKAKQQFELVFAGDLFAGTIAEVTNRMEQRMADEFSEVYAKLWIDTDSANYSFRYQDMPPEAIEKQYEESMSKNVMIKIDTDTEKPVVYYGDDKQEQKNKGAYYTDERFVSYMVRRTVDVEFNRRYEKVKGALKNDNLAEIKSTLDNLLDLKIADFTSGGGSFLRGAFLRLADKYDSLMLLWDRIPDELKSEYSMLTNDENGEYLWEKYILENMIYGVDIDYKAIIVTSLTLTLSSLEHRPADTKLPQLIGRTLIHQNSLISTVPFYKRKEIYGAHQQEIAELLKLKKTDFERFKNSREELQRKLADSSKIIKDKYSVLRAEALEINIPEVYFNEDGTLKENGGMDIVVGNPPWEIWKPNSDEFFAQYANEIRKNRTAKEKKEMQQSLMNKFPYIKKLWDEEKNLIQVGSEYYLSEDNYRYQRWKIKNSSGKKKKTAGDLNLYKVSLERFLQLSKADVDMSILVPDNLVTDEGSTGLRHLIFNNYRVNEFLSFENRKRIFQQVDSRYKFAVLALDGEERGTESFNAFFYHHDLEDLEKDDLKIKYSIEKIKNVSPEKLSLFEARTNFDYELFFKLKEKYQSMGDRKDFELKNDFHKTNDANKFENYFSKEKQAVLYEGKFMNQFMLMKVGEFITNGTKVITQGVDKEIVEKKLGKEYLKYRIALRALASATNERTLIATLLPPNSVATNSLLVQRNADLTSLEEKLFYVGILNSYVLDKYIRMLITTNLNKTYLDQLPFPSIKEFKDYENIVQIVRTLLQRNDGYYDDFDDLLPSDDLGYSNLENNELLAELNARVMIDFDLTRNEIIKLMKSFESAKHQEKVKEMTQLILNKFDEFS